jgi:hypothetical protein
MTAMKYLNRVKTFEFLGGYRMRVTFRDDYTSEVDLESLFANPKGPLTEPFRDQSFFQKAFLDEGTLAWPNGYDICSDVLRFYCEQGRVTSQAEMHAHFAEDAPISVLKDQPKS